MPIVPKNPADQIRFYALHVPVWSASPSSIGLDDAVIADLDAKLAAAEAAYAEALALRTQAEAATLVYRDAVRALHARGGRAVASIKAYAGITDNIGVYAQARIDPPRGRGPARPVPAAPSIASTSVDSQGACTIHWTAAHGDSVGPSSGSYFEVLRQRTGLGETAPVVIGSVAGLSFRDPDIGPGGNIYTVRARRGARIGEKSTAVSINLPDRAMPGSAAAAFGTPEPRLSTARIARRAA